MRYMGSKRLLAKHILPIILKDRQEGQWYVEPFCGGCNTLSEVTGNRIGGDTNWHLIYMWQAVAKGWLPPATFDEELYNFTKSHKDANPKLTGYLGASATFGARWFGSFAKNNKTNLDYPGQCYKDLYIPDNSIIYCDPPYIDTPNRYGGGLSFNHEEFFTWCRQRVNIGHKVFVSEYRAPDDFVCIWDKNINCTLGTKVKEISEKLFVHRSQV